MDDIRNGMPAKDLGQDGWRKPWSDDAGGACVEAKTLDDGSVALRQSTDPDSPALIYTRAEWQQFIHGVKHGKADHL